MTATSYVDLDNDDLGANKILRAATMSALDTNPLSIAQRGPSAPWLNGIGAIAAITSGSGNWTVPAGVYRIKVTAVGGGGGLGGASGSSTTFSTITASGGSGGDGSNPGAGGGASGGDVNITGLAGNFQPGAFGNSGGSGGVSAIGCVGRGSIPSPASFDGGGGGTSIKVFSVEPSDVIAYSVGGGGGGTATGGIIIIEY